MTTASNPVSRVGAGMTGHPRLAAAMLLAALFVALVTKVVVMTGASTSNPSTALAPAPVVFRQGPWRDAIPSDAQIAPDSDAIVRYLSSRPHPAVANIYEYGVPIYDAGPDTPKHVVHCTATWGQCDLEHRLVPIPDDVRASTGSDRAMVVVDWSSRLSYEFWQATRVGDSWQASWGGVTQIDGAGTTDGPVGAGVSRLAGLVRIGEMQRGRIDHALSFRRRMPVGADSGRPRRSRTGRRTGQIACHRGREFSSTRVSMWTPCRTPRLGSASSPRHCRHTARTRLTTAARRWLLFSRHRTGPAIRTSRWD